MVVLQFRLHPPRSDHRKGLREELQGVFVRAYFFAARNDAYLLRTHPGRVIPRMVSGYTKTPDAYLHAEYFSTSHLYSAGGLVSTLDDLARFCTALSNRKLLNRETLRRMWTPARLPDGASTRYGYGWWVSTCQWRFRDRTLWHHPGLCEPDARTAG